MRRIGGGSGLVGLPASAEPPRPTCMVCRCLCDALQWSAYITNGVDLHGHAGPHLIFTLLGNFVRSWSVASFSW